MLSLRGLHAYYGHVHALKGIDLDVGDGEIVCLLGANGAGKSTTLKSIMGMVTVPKGDVLLDGQPVGGLAPHKIVAKGVALVPEGRRIFPGLTVMENLSMGAYTRTDKRAVRDDLERIFSILPKLKERRAQLGGTLSGGEQQMLAIGRALMSAPRMLLMDEPSMGLAPIVAAEIFRTVRTINESGTSILLVEQNAALALAVAHRGYVIETGTIAFAGKARELVGNEQVAAAYLGKRQR